MNMKVLYYDCFCGISGDMNLGALIDLGVDKEYLTKELSKLKLDSEYEIDIQIDIKKGLSGTKVEVILKNPNKNHLNNYSHSQDHIHENNLSHPHDHYSHRTLLLTFSTLS